MSSMESHELPEQPDPNEIADATEGDPGRQHAGVRGSVPEPSEAVEHDHRTGDGDEG